jgi:uncharacterized protein
MNSSALAAQECGACATFNDPGKFWLVACCVDLTGWQSGSCRSSRSIGVVEVKMATAGETDLATLTRNMQPRLALGSFVYCCVKDRSDLRLCEPLATIVEPEGLTVVLHKPDADALGLPYVFESRLITLMVRSNLSAIGFLAVIANVLAAAGIPCNAMSGYHHDHVLVPVEAGQRTLDVLEMLTR